jgi:hypothetical protein
MARTWYQKQISLPSLSYWDRWISLRPMFVFLSFRKYFFPLLIILPIDVTQARELCSSRFVLKTTAVMLEYGDWSHSRALDFFFRCLFGRSAFVGRVSMEDANLMLLADGLEEGLYLLRLSPTISPGACDHSTAQGIPVLLYSDVSWDFWYIFQGVPILSMHWVENGSIKTTAITRSPNGFRTTNYGNISFESISAIIAHKATLTRAYCRPLTKLRFINRCHYPLIFGFYSDCIDLTVKFFVLFSFFFYSLSSNEAGALLQSAGVHRYLLRFSNSTPNAIVVTNTGQDKKVRRRLENKTKKRIYILKSLCC